MTPRPSGWYDDPNDPTLLRYWDGILWSDRTMPKVAPGLSHVGEALPDEERVHHVDPPRRDGEPREYDAHWGPEQAGHDRQPYDAPFWGGHDPHRPAPGAPTHTGQPNYASSDPRSPWAPPGSTKGQPATPGIRFLASLIDYLPVTFLATLIALLIDSTWLDAFQAYFSDSLKASQAGKAMPDMPQALMTPPTLALVAPIVAILLYDFVFTLFGGRTIGKRLCGLEVVPADALDVPDGAAAGERSAKHKIGFMNALTRTLTKWGAEIFSLVGFNVIGWCIELALLFSTNSNPKRQGLHDRLAKTVVRRTR